MNENFSFFDRLKGRIEPDKISSHFARFMVELAGERCRELFLAAELVSRYTEKGHVCLDLAQVAGRPVAEVLLDDAEALAVQITSDEAQITPDELCPELPYWIEILRSLSVVGRPGEFKPLILDESGRLYLYRYWEHENILAENLAERASQVAAGLDEALLQEGLKRLFPLPPGEPDWQKIRTAVSRMFCLISDGPPRPGKISTAVKVLALLLEQAKGKPLRVAMAAPTGKAAARLKESIAAARKNLACSPEILSLIPDKVSTIHRLLDPYRGSSLFHYHEGNLLPYDVVVVDEASMIDLPLMSRLVRAVSTKARLIILGDKDQHCLPGWIAIYLRLRGTLSLVENLKSD